MISNFDSDFENLQIWIDANNDGISQSEELRSLSTMQIESLDLDYKVVDERDAFGNEIRQRSVFKSVTGRVGHMVDIWFLTVRDNRRKK
jgi:trimeric autotransporter adhesin